MFFRWREFYNTVKNSYCKSKPANGFNDLERRKYIFQDPCNEWHTQCADPKKYSQKAKVGTFSAFANIGNNGIGTTINNSRTETENKDGYLQKVQRCKICNALKANKHCKA